MRLIALFTLFFAAAANANIVARVIDAKGNAFAFDSNGKSKRLTFGARIQDMSEIMVDDSSHVSVLDSSGNEYHLSGGTYAKFYNHLLEVKNGKVWTIASGKGAVLVNTINSVVKSSSGQFITSVDNDSLKTQVLCLTGEAVLSSSVEPELGIDVPAGHFSFIDQSYKNGLPRTPTRVGLKSYQHMKMAFSGVKALEKTNFEKSFKQDVSVKRSIASVMPQMAPKKGKVIFIKSHSAKRIPASVGGSEKKTSAMEYYQNLKKESQKKKSAKKSNGLGSAKVRVFNVQHQAAAEVVAPKAQPEMNTSAPVKMKTAKIVIKPVTKEEVDQKAARLPASVGGGDIVNDINSAFEKSLKNKLETNQRHSNEVNQLIDELKTFKQDYSKHY